MRVCTGGCWTLCPAGGAHWRPGRGSSISSTRGCAVVQLAVLIKQPVSCLLLKSVLSHMRLSAGGCWTLCSVGGADGRPGGGARTSSTRGCAVVQLAVLVKQPVSCLLLKLKLSHMGLSAGGCWTLCSVGGADGRPGRGTSVCSTRGSCAAHTPGRTPEGPKVRALLPVCLPG